MRIRTTKHGSAAWMLGTQRRFGPERLAPTNCRPIGWGAQPSLQHPYDQGEPVKPTEQHANTASTSKTALFATLRGLLHIGGSGAPKTSQGTGAPARRQGTGASARRLLLPVLATTLGALAFTATPALAALETPENEKVTAVTATTAHVSGVLNPKATGAVEGGFYGFQYGVSEPAVCGAEGLVPDPFPGAGLAAGLPKEEESFELTGLQPHAKYTFCLLELDTAQTEQVEGAPVAFETKPAPPIIESESASSINAGNAHLEGVVNPNNETTECKFQYGTDPSLATSTTALCEPATFAASYGGQRVGLNVGGLEGHTTYYYRILASNPTGVNEGTIDHFTTATAPETPEGEKAESVTGTTATLHGILNPQAKGEAGSYEFRYEQSETACSGPSGPHGELSYKTAPEPAGSSAGDTPEPVEAKITGLRPGATYTFCLLARNTVGETVAGSTVTFATLPTAPAITNEYASDIEAKTVALNAQIDPDGAATTYHFEYGTTESYGQSTPETALTETLTGTDAATTTITGLQPGTTYHYRVVAMNAQSPAGTPGPDRTFATSIPPSPAPATCPNEQRRSEQPYGLDLPDCRAYEMVSPLDKNGDNVDAQSSRASVSGEALTYASPGAFSEPKGEPFTSRYLARRGPDGWSTQNITTPQVIFSDNLQVPFEELLFTPNLSNGIERSHFAPLVAGEPVGYDNIYVADLASTSVSYQTVTNTPQNIAKYANGGVPESAGASTDLSHVVFQASENLTAGASGDQNHVYEWTGDKLSQVDIPPAGTEFKGQDVVGAPGSFFYVGSGDTWHAVSANGLRVFFTAGEAQYGEAGGQVYVRENPEQEPSSVNGQGECAEPAKACTVEVSASQRTEPDSNGPQPAFFRDANAEGTRVFFTSRAELTNDANTAEDKAANLYEYDLETKELTDLTAVNTGSENPEGADVLGLANAGENAGEENSYVYFVANGVLASNENSNKEKARPGNCTKQEYEKTLAAEPACSLYVAHYDDGTWETKFVATLAGANEYGKTERGSDESAWYGSEFGPELGPGFRRTSFSADIPGDDYGPGQHTVRVTPDGASLAFESHRSLTGYDNEPAEPADCTQEGRSGPCREVYLYSATTEKLVCASCDPSGARPVGPSDLGDDAGAGFSGISSFYRWRNLSENGRRLFFQSNDALVPHDSNGKQNVYEWESEGEGSCNQAGGCIYPISDVAGDSDSEFMDASANGENVFIATADQLVPSDTDTRVDVYDVRVGGGFPVSVPPPSCNNGDSCKGPVSAQPGVFGVPSSATFSGPGNPTPAVLPPAVVKPRTAAQLGAEKLTKALKVCKKDKSKKKRAACDKSVRTKYGVSKAKKAKTASNDRRVR